MDIRVGAVLEAHHGPTVTLEALLGRGGFGQVFLGRLPDGLHVAVKTVLTASLDHGELRTLQNEATHAVGIEHPNVVRVLYVSTGESTADEPPYLVMEFVEGGDLRSVIERHQAGNTTFPVEELRAMYLQIAEGVMFFEMATLACLARAAEARRQWPHRLAQRPSVESAVRPA